MGNLLSIDGAPNRGGPSLDGSPLGAPNNSYWRGRRSEETWKLREALLDGNITVACRLLGIELNQQQQWPTGGVHGSGEEVGQEEQSAQGPRCARWCGCLRPDTHPDPGQSASTKGADTQVQPPATISTVAGASATGSMRHMSECSRLDLGIHIWEDDGGHRAMHYLARGRCETAYAGMRTNFPVQGPDASPGKLSHESAQQRLRLFLILLSEGRLTRQDVLKTNGHGATALHVAAAVGDLTFIDAFLATTESGSAPRLSTTDVDTALVTADSSHLVPVDVAAKFGHAGLCVCV